MGVLMDYHMPVMSGKVATARIREIESQEGLLKIPIFGFTADSSSKLAEELLEFGMNDVLPKPLPMSVLEEACIKCPRACKAVKNIPYNLPTRDGGTEAIGQGGWSLGSATAPRGQTARKNSIRRPRGRGSQTPQLHRA